MEVGVDLPAYANRLARLLWDWSGAGFVVREDLDVLGVLTDDGVGQQRLKFADLFLSRPVPSDDVVLVIYEVVRDFDVGF